ncbi:MAG: T9SS type A sorting domain-containing protein [Bacteroidetes bacterium]|nr:T9SS type A sorting domain-containing protein [Bacteroidota bacterium]
MKNLLFTILFAMMTVSLFSQKAILPPVLVKPTDGASNQMPDAELDWYAVNGIGTITYEVQLDTNDQFQNPVTMSTNFSAINAENLIFGDQYFWRARATDNTGTSEWSSIFDFTIFNVVALSKPEEDDTTHQMPDVKLVWSNRKGATFITGITYYELQASVFEDFSVINFTDSVAEGTFPADTNYYFLRASNLYFDTAYYWRVRAKHDLGASLWSEHWPFSTLIGMTLLTPANNAVNQDPDVTLTWQAVTGINDYIYQVCSDPNFTFPCITGLVNDQYTSVEVPELMFGNTYYWRMAAAHSADTSDWTAVRSFQVINTVLLNLPANGATGVSVLPKLVWEPVNGIDGYELRVYNESFTYSDTAILDTNMYNVFKTMVVGEDYFWKVRTFSNGDTTNWSEVWQFHVGQVGIDELTLNDGLINLYPNPAKGMLTLELKSAKSGEVRVSIIDFIGKVVFDESYLFSQGVDTKSINLNNIPDGLYFIRLNSGDNSYSKKLIISK